MTNILTLQLDSASQAYFNRLRETHFPPDRNLIDAHVTLFHALPAVRGVVEEIAARAFREPFEVNVTGLRSLGKGVAYTLESEPLLELHRRLAVVFAEHLSPQDRQKFQPHIVVQNKVTAEAARGLLHELRSSFSPSVLQATGLTLWHYRGGPWEFAQAFAFQEIEANAAARASRTRSGSPTPL